MTVMSPIQSENEEETAEDSSGEIKPTVLFPKNKTALEKGSGKETYKTMAEIALFNLKDRGGSSRQGIVKYVLANNEVSDRANKLVSVALLKLIEQGRVEIVSGIGLKGRFRLSEEVKLAMKKGKTKSRVKKGASNKEAKKKEAKKTKDESDKENQPKRKKTTTADTKNTTKKVTNDSKKPKATSKANGKGEKSVKPTKSKPKVVSTKKTTSTKSRIKKTTDTKQKTAAATSNKTKAVAKTKGVPKSDKTTEKGATKKAASKAKETNKDKKTKK